MTLSGVFSELQLALNAVWKVDDRAFSISRLLRGRAASVGLVIGLGFLLLAALVIDAGISATSGYVDQHLRYGAVFLVTLNVFFLPDLDSLPRFTKCCQINLWIGAMSFSARW